MKSGQADSTYSNDLLNLKQFLVWMLNVYLILEIVMLDSVARPGLHFSNRGLSYSGNMDCALREEIS